MSNGEIRVSITEIPKIREALEKADKEVERLTKRLEESQLAFLQVDKDKQRLNNKLKDIKSQLDYLETYSSKEDVFEDMKRRLDRIEDIVNRS